MKVKNTHKLINSDIFETSFWVYLCPILINKNNIMKTQIKRKLLIASLFISLMSYANEPNCLIKDKENSLSLNLAEVKKGMQLRIMDNHGILLYTETFETSGLYSKSFDLSNLPNGNWRKRNRK